MSQERTATLEGLMEQAVNPSNWEAALCAVERNEGAPGPDGMNRSAAEIACRRQPRRGERSEATPRNSGDIFASMGR